MGFKSLYLAAFAMLVTAAMLTAQTSKGILSGVVRDATGAVIQGVAVTATNQDTNETRTVMSEATGRYRIDAISPGIYRVHGGLCCINRCRRNSLVPMLQIRKQHTVGASCACNG
ncbi:carboxypeptidase-like regulatory domain-containing protein [Edaphobacter modestus]|uniref:carboxypeptidase-like regulatory domain-containing protein n=1 Tax=Edaphobacter modestus TaxID=388466 RepID=UPI0013EE3F80|nr:carboxypeptidase-like regulatory domain-containing protein [Edaphobacter modestus]